MQRVSLSTIHLANPKTIALTATRVSQLSSLSLMHACFLVIEITGVLPLSTLLREQEPSFLSSHGREVWPGPHPQATATRPPSTTMTNRQSIRILRSLLLSLVLVGYAVAFQRSIQINQNVQRWVSTKSSQAQSQHANHCGRQKNLQGKCDGVSVEWASGLLKDLT